MIKYKISPFISCFTSLFISADITFYNFLELHLTLSEHFFYQRCFLFNEFAQIHHPRNGQNVLGVTRVSCQFSLNCLLKYFSSKICRQNPAEAPFMYQQ